MSNLSSFYPQPVVAGTTEGTFAEGDDERIVNQFEVLGPQQIKRGTKAELSTITPVEGELVLETDTKILKVGDSQATGGVPVGNYPLTSTPSIPFTLGTVPRAGSIFRAPEVDLAGGVGTTALVSGNQRGYGAVDLQGARRSATQVASGNNSFLAGTIYCTASEDNASVIASTFSDATGFRSFVVACNGSQTMRPFCSGFASVLMGAATSSWRPVEVGARVSKNYSFGFSSAVDGSYSAGFFAKIDRNNTFAIGSVADIPSFKATKRAQSITCVLKGRTTNATPTKMVINEFDYDAGNDEKEYFFLPNNVAIFGQIDICAIQETSGSEAAHYIRKFSVKNVNNSPSLIGTVTTIGTDYESDAGYDAGISVEGDRLIVTVTGKTSTNLRWVAVVGATEVQID